MKTPIPLTLYPHELLAAAKTGELETLKAIALSLVNDARREFGLEPLESFTPRYTSEDDDTVIWAIRDAAGQSSDVRNAKGCFQYGETEGENHWISTMEPTDEAKEICERLARAWGTKTRQDSDDWEVSMPDALAEFAFKVALEGDYPELIIEEG